MRNVIKIVPVEDVPILLFTFFSFAGLLFLGEELADRRGNVITQI